MRAVSRVGEVLCRQCTQSPGRMALHDLKKDKILYKPGTMLGQPESSNAVQVVLTSGKDSNTLIRDIVADIFQIQL